MFERVNSVFQFLLEGDFNFENYSEGYNPKKFSGVVLKQGKCRLLLFRSRKVTVTGLKTLKEAENVLKVVFPHLTPTQSQILNTTSSGLLQFRFDFSRVLKSGAVTHEPELFPGVYWRSKQHHPRAVAIFFASGKFILTGLKSHEETKKFWRAFEAFMKNYMID